MRLIDADAMIEHFKLHAKCAENARCFSSRDAWEGAVHDLQDADTIDAEPVVRCKDCTYYRPEPYGDVLMCYGFANGHFTHPDDYCSRGKRKEVEVQHDG